MFYNDNTGVTLNDLNNGNGTFLAGAGTVTFTGVENLLFTNSGSGDDDIITGDGNDQFVTGDGIDTVNAGGGNDEIQGGAGNDTLTGGAGMDSVSGGAGDDILIVGDTDEVSGETYDGGSEFDTLQVNGTVNFTGTTLVGIEKLDLEGSSATFTSDQLASGGGSIPNNFVVDGSGNDDTVTVNVVSGAPTVNLSTWTFTTWTPGPDDDRIVIDGSAVSAAQSLTGTTQHDVITGGSGSDTLSGGDGNDVITAVVSSGVTDTVSGGTGSDRLVVNFIGNGAGQNVRSFDAINGGGTAFAIGGSLAAGYSGSIFGTTSGTVNFSGIESFNISVAGAGFAHLRTGDGSDTITTGTGNDIINSGGGAGLDVVDGGAGLDYWYADLSAAAGSTAIIFDFEAARTGTAQTFLGTGSVVNIENAQITTGGGEDIIVTSTIVDHGDIINTGLGNDTITVRIGGDTVNAGGGSDHLIVNYATTTVQVLTYGFAGVGGAITTLATAPSTDSADGSGISELATQSTSTASTASRSRQESATT